MRLSPREIVLGHGTVEGLQEAEVTVHVDHCWHDRLAGEIHAGRTRRHLHLALRPTPGELAVRDDDDRALNRRIAVTGDDARAFEDGLSSRRRRCALGRFGDDEHAVSSAALSTSRHPRAMCLAVPAHTPRVRVGTPLPDSSGCRSESA